MKKWCIKKDNLGNAPFPIARSNDVIDDVIDEDNTTEAAFTTDATFIEEEDVELESITEVPNQLYNLVNLPRSKVLAPSQQFDSTNFDKLTDFESLVSF